MGHAQTAWGQCSTRNSRVDGEKHVENGCSYPNGVRGLAPGKETSSEDFPRRQVIHHCRTCNSSGLSKQSACWNVPHLAWRKSPIKWGTRTATHSGAYSRTGFNLTDTSASGLTISAVADRHRPQPCLQTPAAAKRKSGKVKHRNSAKKTNINNRFDQKKPPPNIIHFLPETVTDKFSPRKT